MIDFSYVIETAQNVHDALSTTVCTVHEISENVMSTINVINESARAAEVTDTADSLATKKMGAFIGAGLAMFGACGVGAGQGYAAGAASLAVARNPEMRPKIMSTMIVGMAISESAAIYSLIIAILLIFVAA